MKDKSSDAPASFFLLTFFFTWLYWIPCALHNLGLLPFSLPPSVIALAGLGTLGPALAALLLAFLHGRRAAVAALLKPLGQWRVGWRWVAVAVLTYPLLVLVSAALYNAFGGRLALAAQPVAASSLLPLGLMLAITVLGEEIGWRGYALPALQARCSALVASLILGTLVTIWHIPFWMLQSTYAQFGWGYMALNWVWILAATIFITWMLNNTANSVLLAVLFHWSFNMVSAVYLQITGLVQPYLIFTAFSWLLALLLLAVFGAKRLARGANTRLSTSAEAARQLL